jgi:hypothetical protein
MYNAYRTKLGVPGTPGSELSTLMQMAMMKKASLFSSFFENKAIKNGIIQNREYRLDIINFCVARNPRPKHNICPTKF